MADSIGIILIAAPTSAVHDARHASISLHSSLPRTLPCMLGCTGWRIHSTTMRRIRDRWGAAHMHYPMEIMQLYILHGPNNGGYLTSWDSKPPYRDGPKQRNLR